jgi:hypothetical protein
MEARLGGKTEVCTKNAGKRRSMVQAGEPGRIRSMAGGKKRDRKTWRIVPTRPSQVPDSFPEPQKGGSSSANLHPDVRLPFLVVARAPPVDAGN